MPFEAHTLLQRSLTSVTQRYSKGDTILYALGVGAAFGADAWNPHHLRFVYKTDLQALPTMDAMLGDPGFWMQQCDTGLDWQQLVHAGQSMPWLQPLAAEATVTGHNRVTRVKDRGARRGAFFVVQREICDTATGNCLLRSHTSILARGNGGFSADPGTLVAIGEPAMEPLPTVPDHPTDRVIERPTSTSLPLLYRLSTDLNRLHVDPKVARKAGFDRPIMYGMCTYGLMGVLLVCHFCEFDCRRLQQLRRRFTTPLYPGETLRCGFWRVGPQIQFRATAMERQATVLDRGLAYVHQDGFL